MTREIDSEETRRIAGELLAKFPNEEEATKAITEFLCKDGYLPEMAEGLAKVLYQYVIKYKP